jgi:cytochrome c-type biogenesis protein CcmH/NrfF
MVYARNHASSESERLISQKRTSDAYNMANLLHCPLCQELLLEAAHDSTQLSNVRWDFTP